MRILVVYESMFGNTRHVADAVAAGVGADHEVEVLPVRDATAQSLTGADLVIVGGPTHAHSMSRPTTRKSAGDHARKQPDALALEPGAEGPGLREWFGSLGTVDALAAAFDTRVGGPPIFVGRASKAVDKLLRRHGAQVVAPPQSFLVTKDNQLAPGASDHARAWGAQVVRAATAGAARPQPPR